MSTQTTTGRCAACGQTFTTAAHQRPRRRFCSERCRKSDWQRHRHTPQRHTPQRHRAGVVARPDDVTHLDDVVVPPATSAARCPHCARPIAVINLLVAPAAARVPVPGADHD